MTWVAAWPVTCSVDLRQQGRGVDHAGGGPGQGGGLAGQAGQAHGGGHVAHLHPVGEGVAFQVPAAQAPDAGEHAFLDGQGAGFPGHLGAHLPFAQYLVDEFAVSFGEAAHVQAQGALPGRQFFTSVEQPAQPGAGLGAFAHVFRFRQDGGRKVRMSWGMGR
jgi:hypothetical protein